MHRELEGPHDSDEEGQDAIQDVEGEDDEDTNVSTLQFVENGVSMVCSIISHLNNSFIDFSRLFYYVSYQEA